MYNYGPSDQMLTQLQLDVMNVLEKIQEQIMSNFSVLNHLLSLLFYQYLALSLYAVNISTFMIPFIGFLFIVNVLFFS